ncbi:hypothetical protein GCM10009555_043000 [Acrocarpospora macrocephala]|uniref:Uncharacterized protein n=1 Tax=Acrocarpospora macrocephala TaxID=150177 RepID=A0A5M3X5M7_9ACTN|nr:hypothetical protein Amac_090460 [Acrocarpospora macrocephala]
MLANRTSLTMFQLDTLFGISDLFGVAGGFEFEDAGGEVGGAGAVGWCGTKRPAAMASVILGRAPDYHRLRAPSGRPPRLAPD